MKYADFEIGEELTFFHSRHPIKEKVDGKRISQELLNRHTRKKNRSKTSTSKKYHQKNAKVEVPSLSEYSDKWSLRKSGEHIRGNSSTEDLILFCPLVTPINQKLLQLQEGQRTAKAEKKKN